VRAGGASGASQSNGFPASNGFQHIQAGQFAFDPDQIDPTNPVDNLDRLGWAPRVTPPAPSTFGVNANVEAGTEVMALALVTVDGAESIA